MMYQELSGRINLIFKRFPLAMKDRYMLLQLESGLLALREGLNDLYEVMPYATYLTFRTISPFLFEKERIAFEQLDELVRCIIKNE